MVSSCSIYLFHFTNYFILGRLNIRLDQTGYLHHLGLSVESNLKKISEQDIFEKFRIHKMHDGRWDRISPCYLFFNHKGTHYESIRNTQ